jgi:hypothetical protein
VSFKAHLNYGENRAKLARFKEEKKYLALLKHSNFTQYFPQFKDGITEIKKLNYKLNLHGSYFLFFFI